MSIGSGRALRRAYLVAGVAGVGFFAMSVLLLGLWPGQVLRGRMERMTPGEPLALSASELRGRDIYAREGCAYCHTQQVRYLDADIVRFGAPTLAWETRFDYPHLWGTRRIGPDLARVAGTRPADWHFVHLYSPRVLVPDSVMPAYRSLFEGAPERPRQEARDLVAYLETLGRARELAGDEGEAFAREACNCPDDEMAALAFSARPINASPARARRDGEYPVLPASQDLVRGRALFAANCAGCHGPDGAGDGPAAFALSPRPTNLAEHRYSSDRLAQVLWNGSAGTAMSGWRDRSLLDLAALAAAVRALSTAPREEPPAAGVLVLGERVYEANCVQCHGVNGDGRGSAAAELPVVPTDFRRQQPALSAALRAMRDGVAGTRMAVWTDRLAPDELLAVAHYVRGFYAAPPAVVARGGR
ncbi:MAG: cbb3-type cytochrome c oxidase subunit II [Vicinamibacterales bacterium]